LILCLIKSRFFPTLFLFNTSVSCPRHQPRTFKIRGTLHRVVGYTVTGCLEGFNAFIFTVKLSKNCLTLNMATLRAFETSVTIYLPTQPYIWEDLYLQ